MWRRTYLILLLVRIYFALSPSYLHPDEQFQGPEVFAGRIYSYPSQLTWEFTSDRPIRSVFPLWPVYGLPMSVLKWFYHESDQGSPPPELVFHVLRAGMFILSFVLEDWALYELVRTPRYRVPTVVLVASSYVTWTYQTHTFSNSIETLLVLWGLVLIQRIVEDKENLAVLSCVVLSLVAVIGVFNRITFPAFLLVPGLQLLPYFVQRPLALVTLIAFGGFFTLLAIITDTLFYRPSLSSSVLDALRHPVITPLNNFRYNADTNNLATHGLHPHHQHFLANLPQLLGPAFVALALAPFIRSRTGIAVDLRNKRAVAALTGTMILSIFPHQEARFLIPCVPLLLSCLRPLRSRVFLVAWIVFNVTMGFLMGIHHQGGVIPAQLAIPSIVSSPPSPLTDSSGTATQNATVFWWKTYPPPRWLLGNQDNQSLQQPSITTIDLMGIPGPDLVRELDKSVPRNCPSSSSSSSPTAVYLVAPNSATYLDQFNPSSPTSDKSPSSLSLLHQWSYPKHLNLDDLDFAEDGILPTLRRVVGRRGLNVWLVTRSSCVPQSK